MSKKRRQFSREFKLQVIREVGNGVLAALGYLPPGEFEEQLAKSMARA